MSHIEMSAYWKATVKDTTAAASRTSLVLGNVEDTALSTWAGTANIATLGTISSGSWNGTAVASQYGGTGQDFSASTGVTVFATGVASMKSNPTGAFVGDTDSQTLTNKTFAAGSNTLSGVNSTNMDMTASYDFSAGTLQAASPTVAADVAIKSYVDAQADAFTVVSKVFGDSPYTASLNEMVLCDCAGGAITVNLPAASGNGGRRIAIKKTDSTANAVTVDGNSAETIDGAVTQSIGEQYDSLTLICDGTNWHIM